MSISQYDSELRKSERAHIFELSGGIGNQLFQVEAAKMLCTKPLFDKSMLRPPFMKHSSFVQDIAELKGLKYVDRLKDIGYFRWNLENKLQTLGNIFFRDRAFFGHLRSEESGWNEEIVDRIRLSRVELVIRGYFQSYKFLSFTPQGLGCTPFVLTVGAEREIERLRLNESAWGWIHVRRGDFHKVRSTAGLLGPLYYKRGIELLRKEFGIEKFILFSDDAGAAEKMFQSIAGDTQILHSSIQLDVPSTLALMSRAEGAVLANSTFSYWGAARNRDAKLIISPYPWFKASRIPKDLIPPNWLRLGAEFL